MLSRCLEAGPWYTHDVKCPLYPLEYGKHAAKKDHQARALLLRLTHPVEPEMDHCSGYSYFYKMKYVPRVEFRITDDDEVVREGTVCYYYVNQPYIFV